MLIYIKGEDSFFAKEAIDAIKRRYRQKYAQALELIEIDEQSDFIWDNLLSIPLFEPTRLVIARRVGLLDKENQLRLAHVLGKLPASTVFVCSLSAQEKAIEQSLLCALQKAEKTIEAHTPQGRALEDWVTKRAAHYRIKLDRTSIIAVIDSLPSDLWAIDNYLKNYALGHQDKTFAKEQVEPFAFYADIRTSNWKKLSQDIARFARLNEPIEKTLGALGAALRKYPNNQRAGYLTELTADLDLALKTGLVDEKGAYALLSFYSSQNGQNRIQWEEVWLRQGV